MARTNEQGEAWSELDEPWGVWSESDEYEEVWSEPDDVAVLRWQCYSSHHPSCLRLLYQITRSVRITLVPSDLISQECRYDFSALA